MRTDGVGNVIGRIEGRGEAPPVMPSSHMDVVDAGDPDGWEHPPYGGAVAGGCLHGRGAMDVKGPLALQVYAAARFVRDRPAGDLVIASSVYEEKGGWGMMHLMQTVESLPGAVILAEATGGDLCTGHRGHAELAVEIHGVAAHASAPERGHNPHKVLPQVLLAIAGLAWTQPRDPVLGAATWTPTLVESWPWSGNVVPDRVRVTLDQRVLPQWDEEVALAELRRVLAERVPESDGIRVEVIPGRATHRAWTGWVDEHSTFTPGFLLPEEHPVVVAAAGLLHLQRSRGSFVRRGRGSVPATAILPGGRSGVSRRPRHREPLVHSRG